MDPTSLSSNWKKLQATLKKGSASTASPATKRKASDRDSGHGTVKKRKSTDKEPVKAQGSKTPSKRKRMTQGGDATDPTVETNTSSTTLRRKSSSAGSTKSQLGPRNGKVNEGRSPTYAHQDMTCFTLCSSLTYSLQCGDRKIHCHGL